jgi:hypothetical protein
VTGLLTGVVSGVAESVTKVGTGLARVSSFGRGGKTFATYLFDAESRESLSPSKDLLLHSAFTFREL